MKNADRESVHVCAILNVHTYLDANEFDAVSNRRTVSSVC